MGEHVAWCVMRCLPWRAAGCVIAMLMRLRFFSFMNTLSLWLSVPAVVGFIVFIAQVWELSLVSLLHYLLTPPLSFP